MTNYANYAVYSEDDNSLTFLYSGSTPTDSSFGKTVTNVGDSSAGNNLSSSTNPPWYSYRTNIQLIEFKDKTMPQTTNSWFYECNNTALTTIDLSNLDTSNVTSMIQMFYNCHNLTSLDVSNFDTSNVTNMTGMFYNCSNLTFLDVSDFNTSNVEKMHYMFMNCYNLASLDVSNFDTSNVTDMNNMFSDCSSLMSLDVSNFNTSNVTNMVYMFCNCSSLISLDVSGFDTSNVEYIDSMFSGCSNLTSLDVSGFDTSNVMYMGYMFSGCFNLISLDISSFNTSNVTSMLNIFDGASSLNTIKVGKNGNTDAITNVTFKPKFPYGNTWYNLSTKEAVTDATGIQVSQAATYVTELPISNYAVYSADDNSLTFLYSENEPTTSSFGKTVTAVYPAQNGWEDTNYTDCSLIPWSLYSQDITNVIFEDITKPISTAHGFEEFNNSDFTSIDLTNLDTSNVTDMSYMFYDCYNLTSLDLSNFNTSNVTNMNDMFEECSSLISLNLSNFDTSNVINMYYMFANCSSLTSLDLSSFNTSNVINMSQMFYSCSNLTSLDLSNFNTLNVRYMGQMFYNCSNLTSLDLSSFNTSNITNIVYMFYNCSNLTSLDLSNFDTSNVTNMSYIFRNCTSLTELDLSNFNTSNVTNMSYMFYSCTSLTELNIFNFDTSNVTNMSYMFRNCSNLQTIYASTNFNTSNVTNSATMFNNCTSLVGGNGTVYNSSHVDKTYAIIDTESTPGYFTKFNLYNNRINFRDTECSHENTTTVTVSWCLHTGESGCCPDDIQTIEICQDCGRIRALNYELCQDCCSGNTAVESGGAKASRQGVAPPDIASSDSLYTDVYSEILPTTDEWVSLLNLIYPIGTHILGTNTTESPTQILGGTGTNLSSTYANKFLALSTSASGGADHSSVSGTPAGTVGGITVTPGMCTVSSGTKMYSIPTSSNHTHSHGHTFAQAVAKSCGPTGSNYVIQKRYTAYNAGGGGNIVAPFDSTNSSILHNHGSLNEGDGDNVGRGYMNNHTHTWPSIAAGNATSSHTHTFTGTPTTINFLPRGCSFQLGRRDS